MMRYTDAQFDQTWKDCYKDGLADQIYGRAYHHVWLLFLMVQRCVFNLRAFQIYNANASPQMTDSQIWN